MPENQHPSKNEPAPAQSPYGASGLTSLVAQETSGDPFDLGEAPQAHPLDEQSRYQLRAHHAHQRHRERIVDALWASPDEADRKRARRLAGCCCVPWWVASGDGQVVPSLRRCRDRMCPLCATRRAKQAQARLSALVQTFNAPRKIELTLEHRDETLQQMNDRFSAAWDALTHTDFWRKHVIRGVWSKETTRNPVNATWHVHMHLIYDGQFIPQPQLKEIWSRITGGSYIVWVKAVHDRAAACWDMAGYISKPLDCLKWPAEAVREYAQAMHGKRLIHTFGKCHRANYDDDQDETESPTLEVLARADQLHNAIAAGSTAARHASEILSRLGGDWAICTDTPPPKNQPVAAPPELWEMFYAHAVLRIIAQCFNGPYDSIDSRAGLPNALRPGPSVDSYMPPIPSPEPPQPPSGSDVPLPYS